VSVLGLTFKENCPDLRNSKVVDVIRELQEFGCEVSVHDPLASPVEAMREYGVCLKNWDELPDNADALVVAVAHNDYLVLPLERLLSRLKESGVIVDVKGCVKMPANSATCYWRL
jgi:UDP-N-acetyl-D-galactosamine dehydrogenase